MLYSFLGDMADSINASTGGAKDYIMPINWNFPSTREGTGTIKGMTDPEHYHYDRSKQNPDLLRRDLLIQFTRPLS
jgi:hypothetical protein